MCEPINQSLRASGRSEHNNAHSPCAARKSLRKVRTAVVVSQRGVYLQLTGAEGHIVGIEGV